MTLLTSCWESRSVLLLRTSLELALQEGSLEVRACVRQAVMANSGAARELRRVGPAAASSSEHRLEPLSFHVGSLKIQRTRNPMPKSPR